MSEIGMSCRARPLASDVEDLVLEHLRAIRADISEIKLKVDELAGELYRLAGRGLRLD